MNEMQPGPASPPAWGTMSLSKKLKFAGLTLLLLVGALEGLSRLYWWQVKGVARVSNENVWRNYFKEFDVCGVDGVAPQHADKSFDVLLLGASTLHSGFGDIAPRFEKRLAEKLGHPVRVVNCSYPGRTTRETLMRYARLDDRRFDLVFVYDGVNDAHLNNCSERDFRSDYTHVLGIAQMTALERHPEVAWFSMPFTIEYVGINLGHRWKLTRGEWDRELGHVHRTPPSFEANLSAVADIAKRRGDPLVLATFALHLPSNYSKESFEAGQLDYAGKGCPAETWGKPEYLPGIIAAHNEAVRRVAARHGMPLVDVEAGVRGGANFNDPCHFSPEGCGKFVEVLVDGIDPAYVGNRQAGQWGTAAK